MVETYLLKTFRYGLFKYAFGDCEAPEGHLRIRFADPAVFHLITSFIGSLIECF